MNYKVGDKVRIKNRRGENWNTEGEMDHWMGKIMTLREEYYDKTWHMEEDKRENCGLGWFWDEDDFEPAEQLLTPNEVWKWLGEHYCDSTFDEVFNDDYLRAADDDVYFYDMVCNLTFTEITEKVSAYVNEQKKPKGLNMDIVCIKSKSGHFAEGKKYEVRDGYFVADNGVKFGKGVGNKAPYTALDEINARLVSQFIELVEE